LVACSLRAFDLLMLGRLLYLLRNAVGLVEEPKYYVVKQH
jgi:hypothetical protein